MTPLAVHVGRFSPPHRGHERIISAILTDHPVENCLIVVGSSNHPRSFRHLFPLADRLQMLRMLFPGLNLASIPDHESDSAWLTDLANLVNCWRHGRKILKTGISHIMAAARRTSTSSSRRVTKSKSIIDSTAHPSSHLPRKCGTAWCTEGTYRVWFRIALLELSAKNSRIIGTRSRRLDRFRHIWEEVAGSKQPALMSPKECLGCPHRASTWIRFP